MPASRYRPPSGQHPEDERLPLDTQLTILTRQSTTKQSKHNLFSAEVNPDELVCEGRRLGFVDIEVLDWDTGIGAYSTSIEDRPGLHHWLHELLPSGVSRVLLVSQEDRLFRDKWETQHNRFIELVARHGGWVICGSRVYNFRREFDCEQFRMACKYGRMYIEHHIIRRMHPALHRSAMSGRYAGGAVPWGYRVDYDRHSPIYMHFVRHEPHATLVIDDIFARFARLLTPSVVELARQWEREGLLFPFFDAEVDERQARYMDAHCRRDEVRGGYPLHFKTAQRILTDVSYLGWRVRSGEVANGADGLPKRCHEPLVDADLFWSCYDRIVSERPAWAESVAPPRTRAFAAYRARSVRSRQRVGEVRFLGVGKLRCAVHGKVLVPATDVRGHVELHCGQESHFGFVSCAHVMAKPIEGEITRSFADMLVLDDQDMAALAQLAQRRNEQQSSGAAEKVQLRLAEQRARYERAKRLALEAPDLAADILDDMRDAKRIVQDLERQLDEVRTAIVPTTQAWASAERAANWAERIRVTFPAWPREAQARVLALALDDAALGWVSRHVLGLWIRWHGGDESRHTIESKKGKNLAWTPEESEALRLHFGELTWDALSRMFPSRSVAAITQQASRLGLARPTNGGRVLTPPIIFPTPQVANAMAGYGFVIDEGSGRLTTLPESLGA